MSTDLVDLTLNPLLYDNQIRELDIPKTEMKKLKIIKRIETKTVYLFCYQVGEIPIPNT